MRTTTLYLLATLLFANQFIAVSAAPINNFYFDQDITMYDKNADGVCSPSQSAGAGQLTSNAAINSAIKGADKFKVLYQRVGTEKNVPWQMLAAIHYRETTYGTRNPSNGQGIFQFYSLVQQGERFPPGPVTDQEFERQLGLLANLLKSQYSGTPIVDLRSKSLSATDNDPRKVKDVFFSYNGRASVYADQAKRLGFNPATDPFEGSPYVMNLADEQHTPKTNPTGWGGYYADGKFGYYPQYNSSQVGAFVLYAGLGGSTTSIGGSCDSISLSGNAIVDIARKELAKKVIEIPERCDAGNPSTVGDCGPEVNKYTDNHLEYWCADFVSWVYKAAGVPFTGGASGGWRIASVSGLRSWFKENGTYQTTQEMVAKGTTPQPGDVIIFVDRGGNTYHTGIVDNASGDSMKSIEGNTSTAFTDNGSGVGSHTYQWKTESKIAGYGRLKGGE